jgi:hypothetical protein
MNGEYVEVALQDEFSATKRAGSHYDGTWSELLRSGFADADEITLVQIKLDERFRACRDRVDYRAPSQVSLTLFEITNVMPKRRNGNGSVQLHRSTRVRRTRTPTADEAGRQSRFYPALRDRASYLQGPLPAHRDISVAPKIDRYRGKADIGQSAPFKPIMSMGPGLPAISTHPSPPPRRSRTRPARDSRRSALPSPASRRRRTHRADGGS